jgi:hypothetical protein
MWMLGMQIDHRVVLKQFAYMGMPVFRVVLLAC